MTSTRRAARTRAVVALLAAAVLWAPVVAAMGLKEEQGLGARFALEARRRLPLVREPVLSAYLRRIGERIIAHLDAREFDYRFYVVREATLNAFAVPGGYVYVHAGLIDAAYTLLWSIAGRQVSIMSNPFFDHPILNSPYVCPRRHWELDEAGQPTQRIIEQRRGRDTRTCQQVRGCSRED